MYEKIVAYARNNGINLDGAWMVWSLDFEAGPVLCGKNEQKGFADPTKAYDWAREHTPLSRIVVTGPSGRYDVLDATDRSPRVVA
jgi:hypothetical protein